MAETLGSLVDKLTIKCLREYHINEMKADKKAKFSKKALDEKLKILRKQKKENQDEIDRYVVHAITFGISLKDEKLKLYNNPNIIGKIGEINGISDAIERLGQKNIQLWHLEDEARREDVSLSYIGKIKRKIDVTNQHRNDCIDCIDELFAKYITANKKTKRRSV
jgi:hypothetical protein